MFELKRISESGIESALEKVERYRLLNEPLDAESICRDVLAIHPNHQRALVNLILALTDQFERGESRCVSAAQEIIPRLHSEYEREYYSGIICERRGQALFSRGEAGSESVAYSWFREAMEWYEKAENIRPEGNDESLLRWNTCARLLAQNPKLAPKPDEAFRPSLGE